MKRLRLLGFLTVGALFFFNSCKKDTFSSGTMYAPSVSDVTSTATLAELQQGHTLYLNRCGSCHGLYSPDSFSSSNWQSIMSSMAPKAGLSQADATLVLKYVTRGN